MTSVDILILSNGPGEVTTWVRPVVKALRQQLGDDRSLVRISVVLSPCPNATGKEAAIAQSYPEVDRVQQAEHFWQLLLWGRTFENWDWRSCGVVVFLGGDQIFSVIIAKKLGYRTVVYAEWEARWHKWIDRFGVMKPEVATRVPQKYAHKVTVVGDLMLEASCTDAINRVSTELIGILPGSKAAKLAQGVPLTLAIAEYIHTKRPQTTFVIPVAPTLNLQTLTSFADPQKNPFVETFGSSSASLIVRDQSTQNSSLLTQDSARCSTPASANSTQHAAQRQLPLTALSTPNSALKTSTGLTVELWQETPAYDLLSQCCICLTTVGANTAELGALAVPMIVLLPTQQLDAMRSWDGLPGLLANLPGVGTTFAKMINWFFLRRKGLLAWPNIWAKEEIVPELVGKLQPQEVAEIVLDFLANPEKLEKMRTKLRNVRGEGGAAQKLAKIVCEEIGEWEVRS